MSDSIQKLVLNNLLVNDEYTRKVIPYINKEYFQGVFKDLFLMVGKYVAKYNELPSLEAFKIEIEKSNLRESELAEVSNLLPELFKEKEQNIKWLTEETEQWCQDRSAYNAIMESIKIYDGKHDSLSRQAIPDLLTKALSVSFDRNVGHDYIENVEERYSFYHEKHPRVPFDLESFNEITKGGFAFKSLNVVMAGPGVGKSAFMCHHAAACLTQGQNVLYITLEMAEERIAERIDANLMDVSIDDLYELPKTTYLEKMQSISKKTQGKLIIKEYPTSQAHVNHFRALLNELKLKKEFIPDIIFIDYLNICASSRIKSMGGAVNSYTYVKSIAEEVRGLAVEFDLPIVSATQINRSGYTSSDPGMEDTAESFGLPATADFLGVFVTNDELEQLGQLMFIQLKNRYADLNKKKRFVLGVNKSKMQFYDVDDSMTPAGIEEDTGPVFDNSDSGSRINSEKFGDIQV